MPRKKKEETAAEVGETTENEATEAPTEESNSDENKTAASTEDAPVETKEAAGKEEPSIIDSVFETVSAVAGNVASVVSEGVSSVVSAVTGSSDADAEKSKSHSNRAEKIGIVASDKMTKTVTVRVDRVVKHPVYRKYIKRKKKFMAHDETGAAIGDKVRIVETRPLSAKKRWRVVEIIQKAEK